MRFPKPVRNLVIAMFCSAVLLGLAPASVAEEGMKGEDDTRIAAVCQREVRVLITLDTDFADIRSYPPAEYPGIVVLRLARQEKPHVLSVISRILPRFARQTVAGRLWIVEEHRIRVRE